ncbi:MAG: RibD family protein, partial [Candidatus Helarchaeales archaeon]
DLVQLMRMLRREGIQTLLLEGGGTLNYSMIKNDLVDEVSLSIAPLLLGGEQATSLISGEGFGTIKESCHLELISHEKLGNNLFIKYRVLHE